MDHRVSSGHGQASESESFSDSPGYSESLAESVGSVQIESWKQELQSRPNRQVSSRRKRKTKTGAQFMHFYKELQDVPVDVVWAFISDHRNMAALIPEVTESFEYLEGDGGTGSVYVGNYSPKCVRPGEERYQMNKVEVNDNASNLYAVRSVGGKYHARYLLYMTYIQVLPDVLLGDSSSVVVWRLEYEVRNPLIPAPEDSKRAHILVMDMVAQRHLAVNRVERPIFNQEMVISVANRLRLRAGKQRLKGIDGHEAAGPSRRKHKIQQSQIEDDDYRESRRKPKMQQSQIIDDGYRDRRRKPKIQQLQIEDGDYRESKTRQRPLEKASSEIQAAGSGLVFRRRLSEDS